jgi:hypothetical protein
LTSSVTICPGLAVSGPLTKVIGVWAGAARDGVGVGFGVGVGVGVGFALGLGLEGCVAAGIDGEPVGVLATIGEADRDEGPVGGCSHAPTAIRTIAITIHPIPATNGFPDLRTGTRDRTPPAFVARPTALRQSTPNRPSFGLLGVCTNHAAMRT